MLENGSGPCIGLGRDTEETGMKALYGYGTCIFLAFLITVWLSDDPASQATEANVSVDSGGSGCVPQKDFTPDGRAVLVDI